VESPDRSLDGSGILVDRLNVKGIAGKVVAQPAELVGGQAVEHAQQAVLDLSLGVRCGMVIDPLLAGRSGLVPQPLGGLSGQTPV
jgi:hypothetical protein